MSQEVPIDPVSGKPVATPNNNDSKDIKENPEKQGKVPATPIVPSDVKTQQSTPITPTTVKTGNVDALNHTEFDKAFTDTTSVMDLFGLPNTNYSPSSSSSSSSSYVSTVPRKVVTFSGSSMSSTPSGTFSHFDNALVQCEPESKYNSFLKSHSKMSAELERLTILFTEIPGDDPEFEKVDATIKVLQRKIQVLENMMDSIRSKKTPKLWSLTGIQTGPNFINGLSQLSVTALMKEIEERCTLPDPLTPNLTFNVDLWESNYFKILSNYYLRDTPCTPDNFNDAKDLLALKFHASTYNKSTTELYRDDQEHIEAREISWKAWTSLLRKLFNQPLMLHDSLTHLRHLHMMNGESIESWLTRVDLLLKAIPIKDKYRSALHYQTLIYSINNDIKFWLIPEYVNMSLNNDHIVGFLPTLNQSGLTMASNYNSTKYNIPGDIYNPQALIHLIKQLFKINLKDKLDEKVLTVKSNPPYKSTHFSNQKAVTISNITPTKIIKKDQTVQQVTEQKSVKMQKPSNLTQSQIDWYKINQHDIVIERNKTGADLQPLKAFTIIRPYTVHTLQQVKNRQTGVVENNSQYGMITMCTRRIIDFHKIHNIYYIKPTCSTCESNNISYTCHPTDLCGRYFRNATASEKEALKGKQLTCLAKPVKN